MSNGNRIGTKKYFFNREEALLRNSQSDERSEKKIKEIYTYINILYSYVYKQR